MYTLTPRCHLPPLRRSPPPCQVASTTTTTSPAPVPVPSSLSAVPPRADPDELRSTWPQRAWTLAGTAAILSSLSTSASLVAAGSGGSPAEPLAAALAAYSLADLATGVYHWFVDNYGDADTPVFGLQIAAFQGHHRYPSTITRREPCNNLHALARAAALALAPTDAALSAAGCPAAAHAFVGAFAACVVLSQQFHAWAHEKRRRLPPGVEALQGAGVLVSRAMHAAHHRQPYNTNYCIVSGMWNGVLDRYRVFEALEMVVYFRTGIRPRSWDETDASWTEVTGAEHAAAGDDGLLQTASINSSD
ncbi:Fatty acid desaturase 4, chloroplastic [Dichanthelium oligosanthes]|uniref:Fatty acid desaturase 4, chloroplastic n=1 Tax=Dichanthelium oligosanthes TaxID=888268 RepID=A0A1E5V0F8_9POAL|nr:Fatty acid desaturase 4, chloroplastic [Dichanthelium oligosanthes]